jgi:hypothetical protein
MKRSTIPWPIRSTLAGTARTAAGATARSSASGTGFLHRRLREAIATHVAYVVAVATVDDLMGR